MRLEWSCGAGCVFAVSVSARHLERRSAPANDRVHQGKSWTRLQKVERCCAGGTVRSSRRYGTYAYDPQGRVTRSELAGGAERLDFAYATDIYGQPTTTVTNYSGAGGAATSRSYTFTDIGNVRVPSPAAPHRQSAPTLASYAISCHLAPIQIQQSQPWKA